MKKAISIIIVLFAIAMMVFSVYGLAQSNTTKPITKKSANGLVVMELFTSQGCSSCPPADAVLGNYALQNNPNIIPLAFHIDYWNYIGWKDPFSKSEYSKRQRQYAAYFNSGSVYTPQLIINGQYQIVGSNESAIQNKVTQLVASPAKENISITEAVVANGKLSVTYNVQNFSPNDKVNLALVKKKELTSITRGENTGLKQTNYTIVFDFISLPLSKKEPTTFEFDFRKDWNPSDFKIVGYIQSTQNLVISSATQKEIK